MLETAIPPVFSVQLPEAGQSAGSGHPHGSGRGGSKSHCDEAFVVAMLDLDAPTPQDPVYAQIIHTLGGNYTLQKPDRRGVSLLSNSTPALVHYLQPAPSAGIHRYVVVVVSSLGTTVMCLANGNPYVLTLDTSSSCSTNPRTAQPPTRSLPISSPT